MSKQHHPRQTEKDTQPPPVPAQAAENVEQKELEKLASVEWGERLASGKAIARAGKETGFVPGATPTTKSS